MIGEILIFVPSIARFRLVYFQERLAAAHLATLAITDEAQVDMPMEDALLQHSGTLAISLHRQDTRLMLGKLAPVAMVYNLRDSTPVDHIMGAFETLWFRGERLIGVYGPAPQESGTFVDVILPEAPLYVAMVDYAKRIVFLSIFLSLFIAAMIFLSLRYMIVRPLARITEELAEFREHPEDASLDPALTRRRDEIGVVDRELLRMRKQLRQALQQQTRLAALGSAVGKISHDLRNVLSSAMLVSDRLEQSEDPKVKRAAPRLIEALDRAAALASQTLDFAKSRPFEIMPTDVVLADLADQAIRAADGTHTEVNLSAQIDPQLIVRLDREQIFRALLNVVRNGIEALDGEPGRVEVRSDLQRRGLSILIEDSGNGVPAMVRDHLFEPFGRTTKQDGTGLGLAITREILRALVEHYIRDGQPVGS
ncbi:MAG: ATP-binding protein, partial [Pseudomonadota bacterium]